MMKRTTNPIKYTTISLGNQLASLQLLLNSIDAKIAEMDNANTLLQIQVTAVKVRNLQDVKYCVKFARDACENRIKDYSNSCTQAKLMACTALDMMKAQAKVVDAEIVKFNTEPDYLHLRAHKTFELIGNVSELLDATDVTFLNCTIGRNLTMPIKPENTLLTQETIAEELIRTEEEKRTAHIQHQEGDNGKAKPEVHKQYLHIATAGQKDSIIIEKVPQVDKAGVSITSLEQCNTIVHNFNPLEGDTLDISQCGKFKVNQVLFITFTTVETATDRISISGVKIEGREGYVACVYGFDADKFFDPRYVDPNTRVPHMLEVYDVITLTQPQDVRDEL